MPHLYTYSYAHAVALPVAMSRLYSVAFTAAGCSGYDPAGAAGKVRGMGRVEFHMQFSKNTFFGQKICFFPSKNTFFCC